MSLGAGRKNKLITIWDLNETATDEGETAENKDAFAETWAAIEPLDAREQWSAKQSQATTSHTITIWYIDGVTSRMNATWNGRTFDFDSITDLREMRRELEIKATETTVGN